MTTPRPPLEIIRPEVARTLSGLFRERVRLSPEGTAYRWHDDTRKEWRTITWREMARQVARWQGALAAEGLAPGERVAILLPNGVSWVTMDQAALGLGLVVVPLYANDRPQSVAHILADSGARLLLLKDRESWYALEEILAGLPHLQRVLCLEWGGDPPRDPRFRYLDQWLPPAGEGTLGDPPADSHALATLIYTSGTTGRPKGVMLSHWNLLTNAHGGLMKVLAHPGDRFLSFLPLSHALERTAGYYLPMMAGAEVAFSRAITQLAEDFLLTRPTVIISVPRIYERIYGQLRQRLDRGGGMPKRFFALTTRVGWQRFLHRQGRAPWHPLELLWPVMERAVARRVVDRLGGRLRVAVSGGAPIPTPVAQLFISMGVPLVQGYGLTETSPVIAVNTLEENDPVGVGLPLAGVEVRIGENDELLVRGPNVMQGYWGNPEATARVLEPDGWFHTGDQARIDDKGHLVISGRLKDILVLANGRKVAPGDIEATIALDPLFLQAVVVGEGRPFLSALLVLEPLAWERLAESHGLDPADPASLSDPALHTYLLERIGEHMALFPGFARIRRVALFTRPWSVEEGLMTPTLKLRRERIIAHHADAVAHIYEGH